MRGRKYIGLIALAILYTSSGTVSLAQTSTWVGGGAGVWGDGSAWSNSTPGQQTNFTAVFNQTATIQVTQPLPITFGGITSNSGTVNLSLNGNTINIGSQLSGGIRVSGGTINTSTLGFTNMQLELFSGGTLNATTMGVPSGSVTLSTGGVLNLNTAADISGTMNVLFNGGTLNTSGGTYSITSGKTLSGFGTLNAKLLGQSGSFLNVTSGVLSAGTQNTSGFATDGNVSVANGGTLRAIDSDFARFGGVVQLSGGTIENASTSTFAGLTFSNGSTVTGFGSLNARVTGDVGSTIVASGGSLTIGNASKLSLFTAGDLHVGDNTVTLLGTNRATLGGVTSLGQSSSGILVASRGAFVDFGRAIVGTGTIQSTNSLDKAMIINGDVIGNSASNRIVFDGYVKGLGTFTNVTMNGTFAPGLSPSLMFTNNLALGSSAILEMELGGLTAGTEFDQLTDSGNLHLDGTLKVVLINGYMPTVGDQFHLFNWNLLTGAFSGFDFSQALLPSSYQWDLSQLYSSGTLIVTAVPEPSACLLCALGIATLSIRRSRPERRGSV